MFFYLEIYQQLNKRSAAGGDAGAGKKLGDGDVIRIERENKEEGGKKKSSCC